MPSTELIDKTSLRFEDFTIDAQRRGLYRGEERIHLPPTPFKVLEFLVWQRGAVVSKEQLLSAVWGGRREKNTVEQAIRQIRRALGDEREQPRFIETIPGVGYCFIAKTIQIEEPPLEPDAAPDTKAIDSTLPTGDKSRLILRKVVLTSAIAACVLLFAVIQLHSPPHLEAANPVRITRSQTLVLSPLLSDGGQIYYPLYENGRYAVAATPVKGGERVAVATGLANPELCDLAPDGSAMLLRNLVHSRNDDELLYIQKKGGEPQRIGNILAYDAAWFPGTKHILYSEDGVVYSTDISGKSSQRLFGVPGHAYWFRWSPDDRKLRFTVIDKRNEATSLWEVDAGSKEPRRLLSGFPHYVCCGTWTPDGKFFLFQVRIGDAFQIWARQEQRGFLSSPHGQPYPLVFGAVSYRGPRVSKDGRRLFLRAENPKGELVRYDVQSRQFIPLLPAISVRTVAFSRDGNWIAYTSPTDNNVWRCHADGTQCLPLTQNLRNTLVPRWSPNGRMVAFMGVTFAGKWEIFVVPANGGQIQPVFKASQAEGYPDWSPDGEHLVFSEVVPVAQPEGVHILNLRTNRVTTLLGSTGFYLPRWSPDGRFLVALHTSDRFLYLYDFAAAAWQPLVKMPAGYPNWSRDGKAVYFLSNATGSRMVFRVSVADRTVEKIANLESIESSPSILGDWMGLAPDDAPLAVQDMATDDIYAWDLSVK